MKDSFELLQQCRRQWWWSEQPFWAYSSKGGVGWGNMVDKHPGLFNLAWAMTGVKSPPEDYTEHVSQVAWVWTEAPYIPMPGTPDATLADTAFRCSLIEFQVTILESFKGLKRWKFHDAEMSYERLCEAVGTACKKQISRA